ncbi:MAG: HlyD family efflux transporter periplasmic adaptor subunit [Gemmatimonadetes bacterium]|nr:HlyD family efflux transporter periplasmic adaptor subunit [Gemmatimonadota bacterium]
MDADPIGDRTMNRRMRVLVPVAVIATAVVIWLVMRNRNAGEAALDASGTVEATEADLGFQIPGRVARVGPHEGDAVAPGEELAALDAAELTAARDAAGAQVAAARARLSELDRGSRREEVAQAEAALRAARDREEEASREASRAERLFAGGAISLSDRDKLVTTLELAQSARIQTEQAAALVREGPRPETLAVQRAVVTQAEANLERAVAVLANALITAPFAGRVTVRHREPGETVAPGAPVITLLDPTDRWVRIYVAEDRIGRVSVGEGAQITSDSWPDKVYEGRVVHIGSEAEFTPRNVQTPEERTRLVYPVKVQITGDPSFDLKPGTPADVRLDAVGATP